MGVSYLLAGLRLTRRQKCYRQSNFQTLTQLIHGLQSVFVERLAKTWARVPTWEQRVFKDLKMLTSHVGNFRSLRAASNQLSDSWGPPGQKTAASAPVETPPTSRRASVSVTAKGAKKSTQPAVVGCIPFLGLYLRDLTITGELPTYLDPSCPSAEAMRDGQSGLLTSLNQPFAFVDLTPLDSAHLYPLVNVHKARLMACTIQRVLIF
jgi:GDP/GTP exchange factor required for growth at low temperature